MAIARALVRDPAAYLMDDPISALDARLREETRVELKRIQRELGKTLIYVTHDQEEAMSVADRMAILEHGAIRQIGTPVEHLRPAGQHLCGAAAGLADDEHPAVRGARRADSRSPTARSASRVARDARAWPRSALRPEDIKRRALDRRARRPRRPRCSRSSRSAATRW